MHCINRHVVLQSWLCYDDWHNMIDEVTGRSTHVVRWHEVSCYLRNRELAIKKWTLVIKEKLIVLAKYDMTISSADVSLRFSTKTLVFSKILECLITRTYFTSLRTMHFVDPRRRPPARVSNTWLQQIIQLLSIVTPPRARACNIAGDVPMQHRHTRL